MFVESPAGNLEVGLDVSKEVAGNAHFSVALDGRPLLAASRFGLTLDGLELDRLKLVDAGEPATVTETYQLVGSERQLAGVATERSARFENTDGVALTLTVRAYDDAVAIRYSIEAEREPTRLLRDHLHFAFAGDGKSWIQPHDLPGYTTPAYEAEYANGVPIGHQAPVPSWNMPALFETDGRWALLAESDAGSGDFGSHLVSSGLHGYQIELPQAGEGMSSSPPGEPVSFPWRSPWRVIVAGSDLATVATTDVITHLATPSQISDTSWIQPGRVSWSWWSDHDSPRNPEALRRFVDLASEFGWEYTLIDANWNLMPFEELESLIDYATQAGVGVFLWYNSGGSNNQVTEQPRDRMEATEERQREFKWLAEMGVKGVKVDFFHSDRAELIQRYIEIAEDAAAVELMVNYHGSTVPRGWERTWPNIMTMEAVRGAEQYGFELAYPETAVWHNSILPFTRNVIGPMDYTPVTFSDQQFPHLTTNSHELALSVVFESPLQHFADSALSYRSVPDAVQEFLRRVPSTWDESILIDGYPGRSAVFARRSGTTWFVGGIGGPEPLTVTVPFGFLDRPAAARLIGDPGFTVDERTVEPSDSWEVALDFAGGFVMVLDPIEP